MNGSKSRERCKCGHRQAEHAQLGTGWGFGVCQATTECRCRSFHSKPEPHIEWWDRGIRRTNDHGERG